MVPPPPRRPRMLGEVVVARREREADHPHGGRRRTAPAPRSGSPTSRGPPRRGVHRVPARAGAWSACRAPTTSPPCTQRLQHVRVCAFGRLLRARAEQRMVHGRVRRPAQHLLMQRPRRRELRPVPRLAADDKYIDRGPGAELMPPLTATIRSSDPARPVPTGKGADPEHDAAPARRAGAGAARLATDPGRWRGGGPSSGRRLGADVARAAAAGNR